MVGTGLLHFHAHVFISLSADVLRFVTSGRTALQELLAGVTSTRLPSALDTDVPSPSPSCFHSVRLYLSSCR